MNGIICQTIYGKATDIIPFRKLIYQYNQNIPNIYYQIIGLYIYWYIKYTMYIHLIYIFRFKPVIIPLFIDLIH